MRLQIAARFGSLPCLGVALFLSILATLAIRILDGDE